MTELLLQPLAQRLAAEPVVSVPGYEIICVDVSGSRIARVRVVKSADEEEGED